jgi:PAS domain S-box-containing protein
MDSGGIYLVDEQGSVDLVLSRNLGEAFVASISRYPPGSPNAEMVMAGCPCYLPYRELGIANTPLQEQENLRSVAIIPISSDGGIIACLNISSHVEVEIPDTTRVALETIAIQIGAAIERIRANEALIESEERYRSLAEASHDLIFVIDRNDRVRYVNTSAAALIGLPAPSIIGRERSELFPPEVSEGQLLAIRNVFRTGLRSRSTGMLNAQGRTLWFDHSLVPVQDATGTVTQVIGISRDITDLLRAQHAIQEASKKINLLTSITRHDVANQVTILRGLAELAMKSTPDPDISSLLAKIDQAGAAIARHVEFTRTYQEIGMHAPEWFLLDALAERLKPERVSLSGTCRTVAIFADPMLEKVFQNLFDNALQHGERVTAITIRCTEGPGGLTVLFEDNGTGIRPEHKEKIFERGFGENTGMGLFLSREILEITGITIAETGTSGEGARFELHVPCGKYRIMS